MLPCALVSLLRLRLALIVLGCAVVAACLPSRDNPNDPVNRLRASLVIADWTPEGGRCDEVGVPPLEGENAVTLAQIAHCIVLDARGSRDDDDDTAGLRYEYSGGAMPVAVETSNAYLALDASKFDMPLDLLQTFSVTVSKNHRSAFASASIIPVDESPVAKAALGRTLPAGGFPWAPGDDFDLMLEASGTDADGDPLAYCWRSTLGEHLGCGAGPVPITLSTSPQILVALVVATDGKLQSLSSTLILRVAEPTIWTGTRWVDPNQTSSPIGLNLQTRQSVSAAGDYIVAASTFFEMFEREVVIPAGSVDMNLLGGQTDLLLPRYDPVRKRAWAIGPLYNPVGGGGSYRHTILNWDVDEATQTQPLTLTPGNPSNNFSSESVGPVLVQAQYEPLPYVVLSSSGDAWVAMALSEHVQGVRPNGEIFADSYDSPPLGGNVTGLAARPATPEVWAVMDNAAKLVRFATDGTQTVFPIPAGRAIGLAFVDKNLAWTWVAERGFILFDAGRIATGSTFDESVVVEEVVPVELDWRDGPTFLADPIVGTCYATSRQTSAVWAIDPDGGVKAFPFTAGDTSTIVYGTEPNGGIDFVTLGIAGVGTMYRGNAPTSGANFDTGRDAVAANVDWARGGLWIAENTSPATAEFLHIDDSGRVIRSLSTWVDPLGVPDGIRRIETFAASPDGEVFWTYDGKMPNQPYPTTLHSYALSLTTAGEPVVRGRVHTPLFGTQLGYFVTPLAPVTNTSNRLAWAGSEVSDVVRLYDTRQEAAIVSVSIPVSAGIPPARSLLTNDLYVLTDAAAPQYDLVRITTDGAVSSPLATFTVTSGSAILAPSSDPVNDGVWLSFENGGTQFLRSYDSAGVLLHETTVLGATDLLARSAHEVLVNDGGRVRRFTFTPGVLGGPSVYTLATGMNDIFTK